MLAFVCLSVSVCGGDRFLGVPGMVDVGTLLQNAGFLEDGNLRAVVMCTVISR
jgi:hypothetical protein